MREHVICLTAGIPRANAEETARVQRPISSKRLKRNKEAKNYAPKSAELMLYKTELLRKAAEMIVSKMGNEIYLLHDLLYEGGEIEIASCIAERSNELRVYLQSRDSKTKK